MSLRQKLRRIKGGRSYADIAREVGCSPGNVRKIFDEGSEPRFTLGVKLARTLGADVDWLVDDEAEGDPPVDQRNRVASLVEDALAGAGLTGDLSLDEIKLVGVFRRLDRDQRLRLQGFLSAEVSRGPLTAALAQNLQRQDRRRTGSARGADTPETVDQMGLADDQTRGDRRPETRGKHARTRPDRPDRRAWRGNAGVRRTR